MFSSPLKFCILVWMVSIILHHCHSFHSLYARDIVKLPATGLRHDRRIGSGDFIVTCFSFHFLQQSAVVFSFFIVGVGPVLVTELTFLFHLSFIWLNGRRIPDFKIPSLWIGYR